jgi:multiple sugar transport system permease protein
VKRVRRGLRRGIRGAAVAATLLLFLTPILWLVSTSLKHPVDALGYPPQLLPAHPTSANYAEVLRKAGLTRFLANSMAVSLAATLLALTIGATAAYSLARLRLAGSLNYLVCLWILAMRMFPGLVVILPYVVFFGRLHLLDTRLALIVAYLGLNVPFVVWMMVGFFRELPSEMEEAAALDGCTPWQTLWRVVAPLAGPGLAATATFCFVLAWNEFLFALILTSLKAKTIPVELSGFITDQALLWGRMSAVGVIAAAPVVLIALLLQRFFLKGLALGAVKG